MCDFNQAIVTYHGTWLCDYNCDKRNASDNNLCYFLCHVLLSQRFLAVGCLYGSSSIHVSRQTIKQVVWDTFSSTVE